MKYTYPSALMAPNAQALTQAASTRLKLRGNEINSLGLPQRIARTQLAECAHERLSTLPDCRNHMRRLLALLSRASKHPLQCLQLPSNHLFWQRHITDQSEVQ